jgi:hypothetical protein
LVKWSKDLTEWGIQISLALKTSLVLFDTMWVGLCEVQGEVELLLQFYTCVPVVYSILWIHPHSHLKHTPIMCDFYGNISNLCFYKVESHHNHHPKSNQPWDHISNLKKWLTGRVVEIHNNLMIMYCLKINNKLV